MLIVAKARCFLVVHRCHTLRPALSTPMLHNGLVDTIKVAAEELTRIEMSVALEVAAYGLAVHRYLAT